MQSEGKILSFTDLKAWKEGHRLVLSIYKITKLFPSEERYALIDQMRRAAISITSNIAEAFSRQSVKEKRQFFAIALGSLKELQNQLVIARDVGYCSSETFHECAEQSIIVNKLMIGLTKGARGI